MAPVAPAEPIPTARAGLDVGTVTGWTFVFDRAARRLHRLNPTAALVLGRLDGRCTLDELVAALAEDHAGTDPELIRRDVAVVIDQFGREGLIEGHDPPGRAPEPIVTGLQPSPSPWAAVLRRGFAGRAGVAHLGPYRAMGTTFSVTTDDGEVVEELGAVLASLAAPDDVGATPFGRPTARAYHLRRPTGDGPWWRLYLDGTRFHRNASRQGAVDHLLWHVNRLAVLGCPDDTVFHAAAAAGPGGAVLLPGVSNAGKSTLVTGLVEAGLDYLSDEAVLLDPTGALWPYPKAIDLDQGSWEVLAHHAPDPERAELHRRRWHLPPARIRPGCTGRPTPVRLIVAPRYEEGADARLEALTPGDAVTLLLEQAFHLGARAGALAQVTDLVEGVPCHRLVSGDLAASVALVVQALDAACAPPAG